MQIHSRRTFTKTTAAGLGALAHLFDTAAFAAAPDYKALVCIFLAGGNDGHNTIVPIKTTINQYDDYARGRLATLALSQSSLLPVNNGSDLYGLHPSMPEIAKLYADGNVSVVANVGMLVKPIAKSDYQSGNQALFPPQLFSHSDQTNQWQTARPNPSATLGWGGALADSFAPQGSLPTYSPIATSGDGGIFCTGSNTSPLVVPTPVADSGVFPSAVISTLSRDGNGSRQAAVRKMLDVDTGLHLVQAANNDMSRAIRDSDALKKVLDSITVDTTSFPDTWLGPQLHTVARMIKARSKLGISRQIFFCQLGGFDTHEKQLGQHAALLRNLSQSVGAFYTRLTDELGIGDQVVTFTASEFGRTLQPNGNAGTDHAWGSHHFVISQYAQAGGSLKGGQFFGTYPSLAVGGPDDANTRGTIIPTTSVDQYAATLATWFGLSADGLTSVFPNLISFPESARNLGFLGQI